MPPSTAERLPPRDSIDRETHPCVQRRYTLGTPMVLTGFDFVSNCLNVGTSGSFIYGNSGSGKTKLRRLLAEELPRTFPRLAVFYLLAHRCAVPSERVFYKELLKAAGQLTDEGGTTADYRCRLIEWLAGISRSSWRNSIVLLIDSAEYLEEMHYHWLVGIFDALDELKIDLFTFLFGTRELVQIHTSFRENRMNSILSRFMADSHEFHGIRLEAELKACLDCYDVQSRYPQNTGWTFTRYFLPEAFARGWRLSALAPQFWTAYEAVFRREPATGRMEISMKYFARATERFLLNVQTAANGDPVASQELLVRVVAETGFGAEQRKLDEKAEEDEEPE